MKNRFDWVCTANRQRSIVSVSVSVIIHRAIIGTILILGQNFRVADLTQVSTCFLQTFLETKIGEKSPAKTAKAATKVEIQVPARRSPIGKKFK